MMSIEALHAVRTTDSRMLVLCGVVSKELLTPLLVEERIVITVLLSRLIEFNRPSMSSRRSCCVSDPSHMLVLGIRMAAIIATNGKLSSAKLRDAPLSSQRNNWCFER